MKILKYPFLKNTNLANWLILASFVVILLQSCTTPQSVGYNMKSKNSPKTKQSENTIQKEILPESKNQEVLPEQSINNDRLPTLREQMKMIADKQASIEVDVDIIKSEISLIKAELVDLKANLLSDGKITPKQIVTGENNAKPRKIQQKQIEEETYILPDEAVQNNSTKKQNTDKPIQIKPPKKSEQKQTRNLEKEDENKLNKPQESEPIATEHKLDKPTQQSNTFNTNNEAYEKVRLAETLVNSGKVEEARKIYQEILRQNPKNELTPIAKKMLQQL